MMVKTNNTYLTLSFSPFFFVFSIIQKSLRLTYFALPEKARVPSIRTFFLIPLSVQKRGAEKGAHWIPDPTLKTS